MYSQCKTCFDAFQVENYNTFFHFQWRLSKCVKYISCLVNLFLCISFSCENILWLAYTPVGNIILCNHVFLILYFENWQRIQRDPFQSPAVVSKPLCGGYISSLLFYTVAYSIFFLRLILWLITIMRLFFYRILKERKHWSRFRTLIMKQKI